MLFINRKVPASLTGTTLNTGYCLRMFPAASVAETAGACHLRLATGKLVAPAAAGIRELSPVTGWYLMAVSILLCLHTTQPQS